MLNSPILNLAVQTKKEANLAYQPSEEAVQRMWDFVEKCIDQSELRPVQIRE